MGTPLIPLPQEQGSARHSPVIPSLPGNNVTGFTAPCFFAREIKRHAKGCQSIA
ncbi:hypothetical protein [Dickeya lacustris]|uniref:Uncharacterized protein n=1 Tax=Dickeya lacustris TaxID=2259638 RepID=A0ABY8G526_9GAMM|nr:hypothetical protein [Dickeya lacustris]WFN55042.1 hypothetical protein O1Q98_15540 [Dickeya lacustris]